MREERETIAGEDSAGRGAGGRVASGSSSFEIESEIARGGMGVIYEVQDEELQRRLAMKVLLGFSKQDGRPEDSEWGQRFLEEAKITAQLAHPGVVPVHQLGIDDEGRVFFTMNLVRGQTLSEIVALARSGRESWTMTRALQAILRVCETLAFAHDKGVIHRDIKPDNVMVGRFGETYVMDWGLAKFVGRPDHRDLRLLDSDDGRSEIVSARDRSTPGGPQSPIVTMDGAVVGTPAYMPPEQARGQADLVDMRSDVYAVGALLYELLTGQPPYVGPGEVVSPRTVLAAVHMGPPKPVREIDPTMPEELIAVCEKAMARERGERYATASELAEDLQRFISGHVVRAHRTGALIEMRKWVARNKLAAGALAAVVSAVTVGLFVALHLLDRSRTSEAASRRAVYAATLGLAVTDLDRANGRAAAERLETLDPELRGWEWGVLHAGTDRALQRVDGSAATFDAAGSLWVARQERRGDNVGNVLERVDLRTGLREEFTTVPTGERIRMFPDVGCVVLTVREPAPREQVHVFSLETGEAVIPPVDGVEPLVLADPTRLLTRRDREAWVVDLGTGAQRRLPFEVDYDFIISADERTVAASDREAGVVRLIDARTLAVQVEIPVSIGEPYVAFTPDGTRILVGGKEWRLHDVATGKESDWFVKVRPGDAGAMATTFSTDGRFFAYATDNWTVQVIDAGKRGELVASWQGHDAEIQGIVFSPDGEYILSSDAGGRTLVWPVPGRRLDVLTRHASFVYGVTVSPDGSLVATGGWDGYVERPGCVRVSDAATGEEVAAWGDATQRALWTEFFPDGRRLASIVSDDLDWGGQPRIFDVRTGALLQQPLDRRVYGADLDDAGSRLLVVDDVDHVEGTRSGGLCVIDLESEEVRRVVENGLSLNTAPQFFGDDTRLAASLEDGGVGVWDAQTLERVATFGGAEGIVFQLAESPDGRLLAGATTSAEGGERAAAVVVWDTETGETVARLPGHGSGALAVTFSPDQKRIVTGGRDGAVNVWDARTYEKLVAMPGHHGYVYRVAFDPAGERLVSVGMDGDVRVWAPDTFRDRDARRRRRAEVLERVTPDVRRRLDSGEQPADVARAIESDTALSERERGVALQVLLSECVRRRE